MIKIFQHKENAKKHLCNDECIITNGELFAIIPKNLLNQFEIWKQC